MRFQVSAPGKYSAVPIRDARGCEHVALILKITLAVDVAGRAEVVDDGNGPYLCDELWGSDATRCSVRRPSDVCLEKPGTEVLLVGHAHPEPGGRSTSSDVTLRVASIDKTVRAHGLRVWQKGPDGVEPAAARPLREPVPLLWELAFGGLDLSDPANPVGEPRNTVGRGVARDPSSLLGREASRLEAPGRSFREPAGFGALHRHWQPRASFAGTYDERWMKTRMPILPIDFDPRFDLAAPADQWSAAPLRGDEPFEILGATEARRWSFRLPRFAPGFTTRIRGEERSHRTHLDTIVVDADLGRVELTWRAAVPLPPKYEMVERVAITDKRVLS